MSGSRCTDMKTTGCCAIKARFVETVKTDLRLRTPACISTLFDEACWFDSLTERCRLAILSGTQIMVCSSLGNIPKFPLRLPIQISSWLCLRIQIASLTGEDRLTLPIIIIIIILIFTIIPAWAPKSPDQEKVHHHTSLTSQRCPASKQHHTSPTV